MTTVTANKSGARHKRKQRGSAFVITVWVMAVLLGLVIAAGYGVRVEATASADRMALAQAKAAELAGEQFALAAVDMEVATPGATNTDDVNNLMAGMQIGDAWVFIVKPDPDDETALSFGLTDEASKLDINTATSDQLINLPDMTQDVVDSIIDWRDADDTPGANGAESSYYQGLSPPYRCKNANFETVEELLLVKGVDEVLLWNNDPGRTGRWDSTATAAAPAAAPSGGGAAGSSVLGTNLSTNTSNRGIFPFVTVYGVKAGTAPTAAAGTATTIADVNSQDQTTLTTTLQKYLGGSNVSGLLQLTAQGRPFRNIWDWAVRVNISSADFSKVLHNLRATPVATVAKVNVNTASEDVLMCMPSLVQADADAITAYRQNNPQPVDPSDISWLLDVVPKAKLSVMGDYFTGVSYCYSADIVATSLDGRAFKRVRIVVDASTGPAKIIYRRDMTAYGWPLGDDIRANLRKNHNPQTSNPVTGANPF